jgi:hypothetical protein
MVALRITRASTSAVQRLIVSWLPNGSVLGSSTSAQNELVCRMRRTT